MEKSGNGVCSDFHSIRKHLISLEDRDKQQHCQLAIEKAHEIAKVLRMKHGVKQVYLYGSLAWGGFDLYSDIDLFLVGMNGNYWQALSDAENIAAPIEVSLACEEDCLNSLKEKVLAKGVLL
ncbi:MAG: nucleotidyltransferase domain-containing protein [Fermentimonas sp.]|nr:nucleotidyltransferase domain-containing protein [Fermentimonas sp.]